MKFSALSVLALAFPAMLGAATSVTSNALTSEETGWTDLHSDVRVSVKGIQSQLGLQEIAFINQSIIKAYNAVHKDMGDGYVAMYSEPESVAVKQEKETLLGDSSSTASTLLDTNMRKHVEALFSLWSAEQDTFESQALSKKQRKLQGFSILIVHAHVDIACNLCGPADDDAYLAASEQGSVTAVKANYPLDNIEAVSKKLCEILKAEGSKEHFEHVESCSITSIHPVASVAYPSEKKDQTKSNIAITLSGLDCEDNAACQDESLSHSLSDALAIAYNQANFANDMYIPQFSVQSLDIFQSITSASDAKLRGGIVADDVQIGEWKGAVDVSCRTCDAAENGGLPIDLLSLSEAESIFCGLVHDMSPYFPTLSSVEECSLAFVQDLDSGIEG